MLHKYHSKFRTFYLDNEWLYGKEIETNYLSKRSMIISNPYKIFCLINYA